MSECACVYVHACAVCTEPWKTSTFKECALNLGKQVHLKNVQVFRACVGF